MRTLLTPQLFNPDRPLNKIKSEIRQLIFLK